MLNSYSTALCLLYDLNSLSLTPYPNLPLSHVLSQSDGFQFQKGTNIKFKSPSWCSFMVLCMSSCVSSIAMHIQRQFCPSWWSRELDEKQPCLVQAMWWNICGWRRRDTSHNQWQVWWPLYCGKEPSHPWPWWCLPGPCYQDYTLINNIARIIFES